LNRELECFYSWKLERLSPKSFPQDIMVKATRLSPSEVKCIVSLRDKPCYRARIGRGRFYYHNTIDGAVKLAIKGVKKKK